VPGAATKPARSRRTTRGCLSGRAPVRTRRPRRLCLGRTRSCGSVHRGELDDRYGGRPSPGQGRPDPGSVSVAAQSISGEPPVSRRSVLGSKPSRTPGQLIRHQSAVDGDIGRSRVRGGRNAVPAPAIPLLRYLAVIADSDAGFHRGARHTREHLAASRQLERGRPSLAVPQAQLARGSANTPIGRNARHRVITPGSPSRGGRGLSYAADFQPARDSFGNC